MGDALDKLAAQSGGDALDKLAAQNSKTEVEPSKLREQLKHEGFWESAWNSLTSIPSAVHAAFSGEASKQSDARLKEYEELQKSGTLEQKREWAKDHILRVLPFASTAYKMGQGNVKGGLGDLAGMAPLLLLNKGARGGAAKVAKAVAPELPGAKMLSRIKGRLSPPEPPPAEAPEVELFKPFKPGETSKRNLPGFTPHADPSRSSTPGNTIPRGRFTRPEPESPTEPAKADFKKFTPGSGKNMPKFTPSGQTPGMPSGKGGVSPRGKLRAPGEPGSPAPQAAAPAVGKAVPADAQKLFVWLKKAGMGVDSVADMDQSHWEMAAKAVGVPPPSPQTIEMAIRQLPKTAPKRAATAVNNVRRR